MFTNTKIDENRLNAKMRKRLLWLLVFTGCTANMVGFLSNAVMFGMSLPTIVCGGCEVIVIACGVAGIGLGKQKAATMIIVMVLAWFEFPFLFYVYGASMGVYLIMGIVALAIYFPRPYEVLAIIATIILDIIIIILSYFYPSTMEEMTRESQFGTMLCSYSIVAIAAAVMLCTLIRQYVLQRKQIVDISKELEYAANRDALTGVYNRRYLMNTLKKWMSAEHSHFLVALIDVDNFKKINDNYGHVYGDEVLVELARLMKQGIQGKGIVARYGGEEFMLLFEKADATQAVEVLEQIKTDLEEYGMRTRQIKITFSGGVEEYQTDSRIDELFRKADKKLYQAKNNGKNQVVF